MKLTSYEEHKKHAFDSYCKKTLKNETINIQRQLKRQREVEISFSSLSEYELKKFLVRDDYLLDDHHFQVLGYDITLKNEALISALYRLSNEKREIILLSYFMSMTDKEIGIALSLARSTVQYRRTSALEELKERLEGNNYESISIDISSFNK
ncbi:RNA polymerase sigma factor [Oceanobacillus jeddahense]|uniref:RNA polymerase sigma factor n=1 Tax=Oceanobacillus jeddahense TaxID=1462527 RepID=UPI000596071E|nr:sigma factor-like helix-turn-helix DNA-binding protein [Oceanobacillus jeddahense]